MTSDPPAAGTAAASAPGAAVPSADVPGADVPGADVAGAGVPGADVAGAGVPGADVAGAGVPGADVAGADVPGADAAAGVAAGAGERSEPVWRAWTKLQVLLRVHGDRRREVTEALGMSFSRVKALRRVAARGPIALRDLADMLLTDRPYTTLLVDDLAGRGLVERIPNPADRRSKLVRATDAGLAAAAEADRILGTPPPAMYDLPEDDLAALDRILDRLMADSASGDRPSPPPSPWAAEF
ncbi:MarR family winged helix-turn-helix transcriptional regulator [Actinomadura gamaensis]|uniref:MarR family winged helix-turn-helix transcriptional regulator n=1 Tax=Actinomadura gamaensis TaxID=1763541 RepID=A0ABV9TT72_9ACTN